MPHDVYGIGDRVGELAGIGFLLGVGSLIISIAKDWPWAFFAIPLGGWFIYDQQTKDRQAKRRSSSQYKALERAMQALQDIENKAVESAAYSMHTPKYVLDRVHAQVDLIMQDLREGGKAQPRPVEPVEKAPVLEMPSNSAAASRWERRAHGLALLGSSLVIPYRRLVFHQDRQCGYEVMGPQAGASWINASTVSGRYPVGSKTLNCPACDRGYTVEPELSNVTIACPCGSSLKLVYGQLSRAA